jgi:hypothetical protein
MDSEILLLNGSTGRLYVLMTGSRALRLRRFFQFGRMTTPGHCEGWLTERVNKLQPANGCKMTAPW